MEKHLLNLDEGASIVKAQDHVLNLTIGYCQYLLSSQINYTLTNFAEHREEISHDIISDSESKILFTKCYQMILFVLIYSREYIPLFLSIH